MGPDAVLGGHVPGRCGPGEGHNRHGSATFRNDGKVSERDVGACLSALSLLSQFAEGRAAFQ